MALGLPLSIFLYGEQRGRWRGATDRPAPVPARRGRYWASTRMLTQRGILIARDTVWATLAQVSFHLGKHAQAEQAETRARAIHPGVELPDFRELRGTGAEAEEESADESAAVAEKEGGGGESAAADADGGTGGAAADVDADDLDLDEF